MAVSFYRFFVFATVSVARRPNSLVTLDISGKLVSINKFNSFATSIAKMPPKRKATNAKAVKEAKTEEVAAENGAAGDAPKTKKGKAAKDAPVEDAPKEAKAKRGKAKPVEKETEENEDAVQEETPKEAKGKGRKPKAVAEEKSLGEPRPKRGRAAKDEKKEEEKPKSRKEAKKEPKKKEAKPRKGRAAAKDTEDADGDAEEPAKKPAMANETVTNYSTIDFSNIKKNANGEAFNFKIASWNVDGMRAWLKKDGLLYLEKEDPDIVCLQETKCNTAKVPDEVKDLDGYRAYWCDSKKDGYAGVSVFSKVEPLSVEYGIGDEEHDEEGRCITVEYEKFYLVNVYVPNAGRKLITLPKRLDWNIKFRDHIKNLDARKPVIVCGDMNVAHNEIDLANPKTNKKNAGFTQEERDGMTEFLGDGYIDTYRKFFPDKTGAYTFWTYMMKARSKNVGWRLDYFIVSQRFMDNVCDNVIRSEVLGSDHCPITLFLNI